MYELIQAGERSYYIDGTTKIGIYLDTDGGAIMIDSGRRTAGKKALGILAERGWRLKFIINTHSNADHTGGNSLLCSKTGCDIYAPGLERAFIRHPILEPSFVYGGYPFRELRSKLLMAEASPAMDINEAPLPGGMEIFPLRGHFFDMIGVKTPDGVCYLADCLVGENILKKYHVAFLYDVAEYLKTLDAVEAMEGSYFVPAHGEAGTDMSRQVQKNREKTLETAERIRELCDGEKGFDGMLKALFDGYGLELSINQYALVGCTLRSYLSYLSDAGRIRPEIRENRLFWRKA